jgi:hypothetical protein
MKTFSPEYRRAIEASLRDFVNVGYDVACIGSYSFRYGNCQMCPKEGIRWHYVLENLRTHQPLIVGSECVENYQIILSEWGYKPEYIVFPDFLRPYSRWILEGNPNAVVYDDGIVMRFQADCSKIIKANSDPSCLEHYRYAVRSVLDGQECLIGVDRTGRCFLPGDLPGHQLSDDDDTFYIQGEEEIWDGCDCEVEPSYCPDCDNEMCPWCGAGCTCDDRYDGIEDDDSY